MKILGYFVDVDGDKTDAHDVFVAIDDTNNFDKLTIYCPTTQHSEASREYVRDCYEITKEEYEFASMGYYTPKEYLIG